MKRLDTLLLSVVAIIWSTLALMYYIIPAIHMPSSYRVWGMGALVFLVITILSARADRKR
jgi:hypothetical protein